jgi:hypothetical protein
MTSGTRLTRLLESVRLHRRSGRHRALPHFVVIQQPGGEAEAEAEIAAAKAKGIVGRDTTVVTIKCF